MTFSKYHFDIISKKKLPPTPTVVGYDVISDMRSDQSQSSRNLIYFILCFLFGIIFSIKWPMYAINLNIPVSFKTIIFLFIAFAATSKEKEKAVRSQPKFLEFNFSFGIVFSISWPTCVPNLNILVSFNTKIYRGG